MVDPVTSNIALAVPIRGSDVGTWDVPVNGDFTTIDACFGGVTTLALTNSPVTLASSQAQNNIIRLTGTLTATIGITLASIYKFWTIDNQLVNSPSSYCAYLLSTSATSQLGLPPGQQDVFYDGSTINFKNMSQCGAYWDYSGANVPTWVNVCSKPPWLNCNGTSFSSATYPVLANLLGTTTLPDSRGRVRAALDQSTGRLTGVIASGVGNAGGDQNLQSHNHSATASVTDPGHAHTGAAATPGGGASFLTWNNTGAGATSVVSPWPSVATNTTGISVGVTVNANGSGGAQNVQPTYYGGLVLIRAM